MKSWKCLKTKLFVASAILTASCCGAPTYTPITAPFEPVKPVYTDEELRVVPISVLRKIASYEESVDTYVTDVEEAIDIANGEN